MASKQKMTGLIWTSGQPVPDPAELTLAPEELPDVRPWEMAEMVFRGCFQELSGQREIEIAKITVIGEGLFRTAHEATIELPGTPWNGTYAALIPKPGASAALNARCLKEVSLLTRLAAMPLPFSVPKVVAVYQAWGYCILVRERLFGAHGGATWTAEKPWSVAVHIAAATHQIPVERISDVVPGFETRGKHGDQLLAQNDSPRSELAPSLAWLRQNRPSDTPPVLVHGNLVPSNVVLDYFNRSTPPGVLDWDFSVYGDPALDLATICAAADPPLTADREVDRVLKAYRAAGGGAVSVTEVRFHQICIHLRRYHEALAKAPGRAGDELRHLQTLLKPARR
ncbi:MAG TPA: aminoglycoside phosphotransferase family protein [Candidatus Xenobia bacterium]|jgi:hypothetical protein